MRIEIWGFGVFTPDYSSVDRSVAPEDLTSITGKAYPQDPVV